MDNLQGGTVPASATPPAQGTVPVTSAGNVAPQSLPNASAEPSATPTGQGVPQGVEGQVQSGTLPDDVQRQVQSQVDKIRAQMQAELYRMQQEMARNQTPATPNAETNPHVPNSTEWWLWQQQKYAEQAAEKAVQGVMKQAQVMSQQQSEYNWIQTHPGVDINSVKWFLRSKGIPDHLLDEGYQLMNIPQIVQGAAQTASQNAVNQFRQPTQGTIPITGQAPSAGNVALSYEADAREYTQNHGKVNWTPERMKMFLEETEFREMARRNRTP